MRLTNNDEILFPEMVLATATLDFPTIIVEGVAYRIIRSGPGGEGVVCVLDEDYEGGIMK